MANVSIDTYTYMFKDFYKGAEQVSFLDICTLVKYLFYVNLFPSNDAFPKCNNI